MKADTIAFAIAMATILALGLWNLSAMIQPHAACLDTGATLAHCQANAKPFALWSMAEELKEIDTRP